MDRAEYDCDKNFNENDEDCDHLREPVPSTPAESEPVRLSLLPPDHPLLEKFQQKLKEHLLHTKEQLVSEIAEIKYHVKTKLHQREEQGSKLYDMQQDIHHQNEQLEEFTHEIQAYIDRRRRQEAEVEQLRAEYDEKAAMCKERKAKYNKRMVELEHMNTLEGNIRKWADEVEDEVKNAKRVVNRDTQLQKQLSEEKKKSDMLFYHLDTEVKKREEEARVVRAELVDMREIMQTLRMSINTANTDLETLQNEHKRLSHAWNDVIVAIHHRDKLLHQVNTNVAKQQEQIKLAVLSIEAIRKQITKELKQNEKLETFKLRLLNDFTNLKRECQKESETLTLLQVKLEELPHWLEQTEKDLQDATKEGNNLEIEIRRIQFKVEKQYNKKFQIEENILKLAQDQLITDKASQYRLKLLNKAQEQRRTMELTLSQSQNTLSETTLQLEKYRGYQYKQEQENLKLRDKLLEVEKRFDHLAAEMYAIENQIDLKLKRIDRLSNKLDEIMRAQDGGDINTPTALKIKHVEKSIQSLEQQIRERQQFWLMLQNHFVNLTQKRNEQLNEIQVTQKQLSIIKQKSLKIDNDLELSETNTRDLVRDIQVFMSKVEQLNEKVAHKRQEHEVEESECELEHAEILAKLKENEMKVLNLESEIDELQTDIEHYKDLVLDKHRESLSWETKYKLVEETMRWRKDEHEPESEICTMKTEIHRMQIRHQQLVRAQEKLVQDLQHCVMHREQIFVAATTKQRVESKIQRVKTKVVPTAITTVQQKVTDLRNKLKQIQNEITKMTDVNYVEATREHERIHEDVKHILAEIERQTTQNELLCMEIDEGFLLKHLNLENIVRKQNRSKSYRRLNATTPTVKTPRSETTLQSHLQKQNDTNDTLYDVLQTLIVDIPEKKTFFTKIMQILKD